MVSQTWKIVETVIRPGGKVEIQRVTVKACKFFAVSKEGKLEALDAAKATALLKKRTVLLIGGSAVVDPRHLTLVKPGTPSSSCRYPRRPHHRRRNCQPEPSEEVEGTTVRWRNLEPKNGWGAMETKVERMQRQGIRAGAWDAIGTLQGRASSRVPLLLSELLPGRGNIVRGLQPGRQDAGLGGAWTRRSSCGT